MPATSMTLVCRCLWCLLMWPSPRLMWPCHFWSPSSWWHVSDWYKCNITGVKVAALPWVGATANRNKDGCGHRHTICEHLVLGADLEGVLWILAMTFIFGNTAWGQHQSSHTPVASWVVNRLIHLLTSRWLPQLTVELPITMPQLMLQPQYLKKNLRVYYALNVLTILRNFLLFSATSVPFILFLILTKCFTYILIYSCNEGNILRMLEMFFLLFVENHVLLIKSWRTREERCHLGKEKGAE